MKKTKKVILYFPNPLPYNRSWKGIPLSLLAISRVLDKKGYQVKIFSRFLQNNLEKEIIKHGQNSICLGISAMTGFQIYDGLKIAKLFKKHFPKTPIVWGGWHVSILPIESIKNKFVDMIIRGPADEVFPKLVFALENKKSLTTISGLTYKKANIIHTNPDQPMPNLNKLPPLPYHLVDIEKCLINTEYGKRTLSYISSYGCPHRCSFCVEQVVNKRRWSALNATKVVKEWQYLYKRYQIDSIAVYDSNFFVDQNRVYKICQGLLTNKISIKWGNANGRIRQLSQYKEKVWKLMKKTGCVMILTGAESGSQKALDFIKKDMDVKEIIKFTRLCKKYKIKILYSFLVGLPWSKKAIENKKFVKQEYATTLSLIDKLLKICDRNRYTYYVFLPYPGAPLFKRAVKLGLKYPKNLKSWSTYLMSPEDAFKITNKQKWITHKQSRLTAMLTQYIFGLMDKDTYDLLQKRIPSKFYQLLFKITYKLALIPVKLRWKFKFFDFPLDYYLFTLVYKHAGLM
ncbi:B12-binding domain-containing radical SAM protein [Patescibacteria group bacterium]|nr:B12-binding domain-containing radical SAM protein [Patescibacteria group bacterium]MCG2702083.1 B12-binding domain-containing radical SAM protein [Candidatus Parcubacteria bacterium]MBU4265133.1 B12-binding domain-containing radical SAM protein [Patescibacteria group bacterium]MBU4390697.1 B12-binding domain-containing radical SAM protein [Patescibacteria group bacterium]MBU4430963.1 B12-binding domain-containing radical SAM protein [Patescibacteria group bacterium]